MCTLICVLLICALSCVVIWYSFVRAHSHLCICIYIYMCFRVCALKNKNKTRLDLVPNAPVRVWPPKILRGVSNTRVSNSQVPLSTQECSSV